MNETRAKIILTVCNRFKVALRDFENRRDAQTCKATFVACRIFRLMGYSYEKIARVVGKSHPTVCHSIKRCREDPQLESVAQDIYDDFLSENNPELKKLRKDIKKLFNSGQSLEEIAKELKIAPNDVQTQINYFELKGLGKRIPDYTNYTTKYIYK